ncbi:cytochrome c nitrite reductase subunit NrfD [Shewanella eurypsychrophilus]|uniref:Cytochrome c nitrite reductase subunit NrfD n=1 Tax=Shewanella eurypsychrophilus TaxID=2593656 RepID=A0ABX6V3U6_9GAMM|nr:MULTISPECIES: cytochrome c nitrite reductase subunit NrfD [Shewanella]QFU21244.1 cytochrome c nitrite reductase subunit NrfD [Shewanella sp. YLB-09]QPG56535.1 cytochrome c nitrite reductase subunit NrfD [Shewanella eurypsychrophilus]
MSPFHFDSLVWHWPIAIYLFLAGISAGAICFAVLLKHFKLGKNAYKSSFVQAACLLAPLAVFGGLGILVIDLTKPFDFWKILVFYNPTSIMSVGVAVLMIYQVALFSWLACVFKEPISNWCDHRWTVIDKVLNILARYESTITGLLVMLALSLGAYTGFLLSALTTYPMLNNPVLPILFLVSGISSGAAGTLLGGLLLKGNPDGKEVHFIHKIEIPLILFELVLLFTFFIGLIISGGQSQVAAFTAIGEGFWGWIFWAGIIVIGLTLPLAFNLFMTVSAKRKLSYVAITASCSLLGVLLLRNFILYTGQMTVA